jgi:PleD family two-component response regulator
MVKAMLETKKLAPRRILVVDDHPLMRRGIVAMIDHEPDLEVCAQAASATRPDHRGYFIARQ